MKALCLESPKHFKSIEIEEPGKPGAKTVTSALRGVFQENKASRAEVMALIQRGQG